MMERVESSRGRVWRLSRRPTVWTGAAVLMLAGAIVLVRARGPVVATAVVLRMDIEQHLVASGRVRVTSRIQLSAQISGRIAAVHVDEGDQVQVGQVLVVIDDAELRAEVAQARAAVEQASGRLDQVRDVDAVVAGEAARRARTNLARAESELARVQALEAAGALAPTDLEDAQRSADNARADLAAAQAQESAATAGGVSARVAANALAESRARLAAAQARLEQTRLTARHPGIVLERGVDPGDSVRTGDTLLELAAGEETELVIEPDERNLAWIRLGQPALVSADAYPEQIFEAEVSHIAPSIDPQRGSVEVRLRVPEPPVFLRPDMTVSVDLTVASAADALTVPSEAVRAAASAAPWVLVFDDGRVARREVQVGIRGEGHTQITSGLEEGTEVVLPGIRSIEPGDRVRPERSTP